MGSHRATTTVVIRELELTRDDVVNAVIGYYESAGWGRFSPSEVDGEVADLLELAVSWPVGTVLERRLDLVRVRSAFT